MFNESYENENSLFKLLGIGGVIIIGFAIIFSFFEVIDEGERGVVVGFGQVKSVLGTGFNFVNPLYDVYKYSIRNNRYDTVANAASSDLQKVQISVAVNYNLDESKVDEVYKTYKSDYIEKVFTQNVQEAVKGVSAKYQATELVTKRDEVKAEIQSKLLAYVPSIVQVTSISITNIEFSPQFDAAIEAKVTAEQNALKAQKDLERTKFEADQRVAQATGESEAIRLQTEAIKSSGGSEYVQLKSLEVQKAAVDKWNGVLPTQFVPGSAVPFLNLK